MYDQEISLMCNLEKIQHMINIIENNLDKTSGEVESLISNEMGMNQRAVQDVLGFFLETTIAKYIVKRRIAEVIDNVRELGIPLEEAACQQGFADYSGFYKAFKKRYGKSPEQVIESDWEGTPRYSPHINMGAFGLVGYDYGAVPASNVMFLDEETGEFTTEENWELVSNESEDNGVYEDLSVWPWTKDQGDEGMEHYGFEAMASPASERLDNFTLKQFNTFEAIDNIRTSYGLDLDYVLEAYNKCKGDILKINQMCMNYIIENECDEDETWDGYEMDFEDEEFIEDYYADNYTLQEYYDMYYGDDEFEYEFRSGVYGDNSGEYDF